jgi:hexosaminidase
MSAVLVAALVLFALALPHAASPPSPPSSKTSSRHRRRRRRRRRGRAGAEPQGAYPACARGLFPLPSSVACGDAVHSGTVHSGTPLRGPAYTAPPPRRAWLDPADFGFRFAAGSKSAGAPVLAAAFNRTLRDLARVPAVVARQGAAEPGIATPPHLRDRQRGQDSHPLYVVRVLELHIADESSGAGKTLASDESYELKLALSGGGEAPSSSSSSSSSSFSFSSSESSDTGVTATLTSATVWGALYGLTTFTQLFFQSESNAANTNHAAPNMLATAGLPITIQDGPRFPWRGVLLDTANHYFPLSDVLRTVDALSMNKFNVLHWHIVDSYSFPFQSTSTPGLGKGAWTPDAVYSPQDVRTVRDYALERGVRVVLEVDMPGHAFSWGVGVPNVTVACPAYGKTLDIGHVNAVPLDPSSHATYDVVDGLLRELVALLDASEGYLHLGGDEIEEGCWNASAAVVAWKANMGLASWTAVKRYFYRKVWSRTVAPLGKKAVTWEDLYLDDRSGALDFNSSNVPFTPDEAVIEVWTDTKYLSQAVAAGYDAIYAAAWYLDRQQPVDGVVAWEWLDTMWQMYDIEPEEHVVPSASSGKVLGGEASMWSEQVDTATLDARMWPRASAVAERLWSPKSCTDHEYAAWRLREHRCRMVASGVGAGPFWSEHCVVQGGRAAQSVLEVQARRVGL